MLIWRAKDEDAALATSASTGRSEQGAGLHVDLLSTGALPFDGFREGPTMVQHHGTLCTCDMLA